MTDLLARNSGSFFEFNNLGAGCKKRAADPAANPDQAASNARVALIVLYPTVNPITRA